MISDQLTGRAGRQPPVWAVASSRKAFLAILRRDLFVTGKDFWVLLIQVSLTPLFMLFIFAVVLSRQGFMRPNYVDLIQPGILALAAFMTAVSTVAMPLVLEFGFTKEIEDRLLAPLRTQWVAMEKLLIAMLRGLFATIVIYPLSWLVIGSAPWQPDRLPLLLAVVLLGGWCGGGVGMTIATLMPTHRINVVFNIILTPLIFTGCVQYPWHRLDTIRWFQIVTAVNPLTYCSEGVRAALVPHVQHIAPWICLAVLSGTAIIVTVTAVLSFARRAARG